MKIDDINIFLKISDMRILFLGSGSLLPILSGSSTNCGIFGANYGLWCNILASFNSIDEKWLQPSTCGGGAYWPIENQNSYISGTKSPIDLKPGCKFKFVSCLETYLKKLSFWAMKGPCKAFFNQGCPEICLAGSILGSIGVSMKVQ